MCVRNTQCGDKKHSKVIRTHWVLWENLRWVLKSILCVSHILVCVSSVLTENIHHALGWSQSSSSTCCMFFCTPSVIQISPLCELWDFHEDPWAYGMCVRYTTGGYEDRSKLSEHTLSWFTNTYEGVFVFTGCAFGTIRKEHKVSRMLIVDHIISLDVYQRLCKDCQKILCFHQTIAQNPLDDTWTLRDA